jgi:hypothetical protein
VNIFVLDEDPVLAAQAQFDRHVVKMVLESAQLLCNQLPGAPYKPTHAKHPCSLWAGRSKANYEWLLTHAEALAMEYMVRYTWTHACREPIAWCRANYQSKVFPMDERTPFAICTPGVIGVTDPVQAYRNYYMTEKRHLARWTRREPPKWWR